MKLRTIIASSVLSIGILSSCASYAYAPTVKHVESKNPPTITVDYSFNTYRKVHNTTTPLCTLPSVEDGKEEVPTPRCEETHLEPTQAQQQVWDMYTMYLSCHQFKQDYACQNGGK